MRIAPDSKTLIGLPPGPSGSTIAGMRLLGLILRKSGLNCSPFEILIGWTGEAHFLECDRDLAAVRGAPGVKFDGHVMVSPAVAQRSIAACREPV